jgi:hypothetical protein
MHKAYTHIVQTSYAKILVLLTLCLDNLNSQSISECTSLLINNVLSNTAVHMIRS